MASYSGIFSTTFLVLEDVAMSNENNTNVVSDDLIANMWRYGWPPLCTIGIVIARAARAEAGRTRADVDQRLLERPGRRRQSRADGSNWGYAPSLCVGLMV